MAASVLAAVERRLAAIQINEMSLEELLVDILFFTSWVAVQAERYSHYHTDKGD